MNNWKSNILGVIVTFAIVVSAAWVFVVLSEDFRKDNIADAPTTDQPPQIDEPQVEPVKFITKQLLKKPFTPQQDVYSNQETYLKSSIKLALKGEFDTAKLVVEGKITDNDIKFVSVNIGTESGVLNAVRENANSLNIGASDEKGGVFKSSINFTLDLLGETSFATTKEEFQLTRQKTKIVKLWNFIYPDPPTVTRVLVAPFNKAGQYGNAEITSIEFKYLCANGSDCDATICEEDSLFTLCLKDSFGIEAAKKWCEETKFAGCENL